MDFSAMIQTWINAVTQPNEAFYDNERRSPNATLGTAIIWIVIAAVVSALVGALGLAIGLNALSNSGVFEEILSDPGIPDEARLVFEAFLSGGGMGGLAGGALVAGIIWAPIGFLIGTGIMHLIARLLGGQGDFGRFSYLVAAFQAPISIVSSLLGLVPFLGGCVSGLLGIYSIFLAYFAIKTEHQLTQGKSIMVLLIPLIIAVVLAVCVGIAVVTLVAAVPQ